MSEKAEEKKDIPLGELEFYPNAGSYIADVLKEHGVEIAFGVHGGHFWQVLDEIAMAGIKLITFRHEQSAVYAAEAYSKVKRRPGVAFATVGPGTGNIVSAVQQVWLSRSPVIILLAGHEPEHDRLGLAIQEAYAEDIFKGITKWVQRIVYPEQVKQFTTRAFKEAMTYPYGPVVLEIACSCITTPVPPRANPGSGTWFGVWNFLYKDRQIEYVEKWRRGEDMLEPMFCAGVPEKVEKAVKLIYEAKSPILYVGDGVHWSDASKELVEFAELAQCPVVGRRLGRGAMPETHPLALSSRAFTAVRGETDLFVSIGAKIGFFDGYGREWSRTIQIAESPEHIWTFLKTELVVIGTPKIVLQQMINYVKSHNLKPPPERKEWVEKIQKVKKEQYERLVAKAEKYKDHKPLHHAWIMKVLWDIVEERYGGENYIIQDGYTMSCYSPPFIKARKSGQCMDASEQAGVGHSIGMSIGICFANPEFTRKKPVIALLGDAGVGNSGMDIETAQRYNLPIVYIITNNDGWLTSLKYTHYTCSRGKGYDQLGPVNYELGPCEVMSDIRYDKMFEVIGCHGEWVTEPAQLKDALNRAFDAAEKGKVAVVNIDVDPRVSHVEFWGPFYTILLSHLRWNKLNKRAKAARRSLLSWFFPFDKYGIPPMSMPDPWEPMKDEEMEP